MFYLFITSIVQIRVHNLLIDWVSDLSWRHFQHVQAISASEKMLQVENWKCEKVENVERDGIRKMKPYSKTKPLQKVTLPICSLLGETLRHESYHESKVFPANHLANVLTNKTKRHRKIHNNSIQLNKPKQLNKINSKHKKLNLIQMPLTTLDNN